MANVKTSSQCFLTTVDNPFDPYEDFISWFMFDTEKGYNRCGKLMRFADLTDDMSEEETEQEIETAIDRVIKCDALNIYKKFKKTFRVT